MKLDPGMHIGMHLVFFGKTGVTTIKPKIIQTMPTGPTDQEHLFGQQATSLHQ
jgi:hypothetical protein